MFDRKTAPKLDPDLRAHMSVNSVDAFRSQIERLLPFVAPLLVCPLVDPGVEGWITGGSVILVRTEQNRFLITADHFVHEMEIIRGQRDIVVLLGGASTAPIDISNWPILARDDHVDICTFQVPHEFEAEELNKAFFVIDRWPPTQAEQGDQVLIMGYPAAHRHGFERTINARILPLGDFVTHVGPRRFTIADENEQREILINPDKLAFPPHLGGMSGSPVFRVSSSTFPEFVGVLVEGGDGFRGACFCSHAYFLLPSGKLDITRIPPR
jgi:hypothetical protein